MHRSFSIKIGMSIYRILDRILSNVLTEIRGVLPRARYAPPCAQRQILHSDLRVALVCVSYDLVLVDNHASTDSHARVGPRDPKLREFGGVQDVRSPTRCHEIFVGQGPEMLNVVCLVTSEQMKRRSCKTKFQRAPI